MRISWLFAAILLALCLLVAAPPCGSEERFALKKKIVFVGGVHGNEPAGSEALKQLVAEGYFEKYPHTQVLHSVNKYGLARGVRHQHPATFLNRTADINRNFGEEGGMDDASRAIVAAISNAALVVDFHEGWGFHKITPTSIGSTVTPSPLTVPLGKKITERLNLNIKDPAKKFTTRIGEGCDIKTSLGCFSQRKKIPYVLIETTGQKDIQPLAVRVAQVKEAVRVVLEG